MWELLSWPFDQSGFPARWFCGSAWQQSPALAWTHIVADLATFAAYTTIPLALAWFVLRRRDMMFTRMLWLFSLFIFTCGTVHLVEALIFWYPVYRLSAVIKVITAAASCATVVALIPILPRALAMRTSEELEREIAQRKKTEALLQDAIGRAQAANEAKTLFMANMSHEIRTPLNAVIGLTDLVLASKLTREQHEHLVLVQRSGETLLSVVNDLLDFSKIEAGRLVLTREPFDLHASLGETMKSLALRAHQKGVELIIDLEPDVPAGLIGDKDRL